MWVSDPTLMIAIYGIAGWAILGTIGAIWRWYRKRTAFARSIRRAEKALASNKIPEDYSVIEQKVRQLNNAEEAAAASGTVDPAAADGRRHRLGELARIRTAVGRVRESGFIAGNNGWHRKQTIEDVLKGNPYAKRKDIGAYKQWIRGACMGMSKQGMVYNPADFI